MGVGMGGGGAYGAREKVSLLLSSLPHYIDTLIKKKLQTEAQPA